MKNCIERLYFSYGLVPIALILFCVGSITKSMIVLYISIVMSSLALVIIVINTIKYFRKQRKDGVGE